MERDPIEDELAEVMAAFRAKRRKRKQIEDLPFRVTRKIVDSESVELRGHQFGQVREVGYIPQEEESDVITMHVCFFRESEKIAGGGGVGLGYHWHGFSDGWRGTEADGMACVNMICYEDATGNYCEGAEAFDEPRDDPQDAFFHFGILGGYRAPATNYLWTSVCVRTMTIEYEYSTHTVLSVSYDSPSSFVPDGEAVADMLATMVQPPPDL